MNKQEYFEGKESQKFNLKKPSKKEIESMLYSLDGLLLEDTQNGYKLGVALANLQRYFAPNDTAKTVASDSVKWCLQAIWTKDGSRKALSVAKIVDGTLIATDSRRMHVLSNYAEHKDGALLPDGTWISEEEYTKEFGTFPNYKQVMPCDPKPQPDVVFSVRQDAPGRAGLSYKKGQLSYYVADALGNPQECCLDGKYYKQAVAGMEKPSYCQTDELSLLVVESGDRYAVVMPIRIS